MEYEKSEISENTENNSKSIFAVVFGIVAVAMYLAIGIMLIFTNIFQIPRTMRIAFGIVLVLYSFYRVYRSVKK